MIFYMSSHFVEFILRNKILKKKEKETTGAGEMLEELRVCIKRT